MKSTDKETKDDILCSIKNANCNNITDYIGKDGYVWAMILVAMDKYSIVKMIEENKSLLKMAELHMDSRAILVITERIKNLESSL